MRRISLTIVIAIFFLLIGSRARAATVTPTYFLVAELPGVGEHGDSFVVPLTDSALIGHARDNISLGPDVAGRTIIFASIAPGEDGINRNLNAPGQPNWNWHVTEVEDFNDFGIELIDSTPTFVSEHLAQWMTETGGKIGFWNYTVVAELPGYPDVVPPPTVPLPAALPAIAMTLPLLCWALRRKM